MTMTAIIILQAYVTWNKQLNSNYNLSMYIPFEVLDSSLPTEPLGAAYVLQYCHVFLLPIKII